MSDTESTAVPADRDVVALLAAAGVAIPRAVVTQIVRRVEMDGKVSETRLVLRSPTPEEDAA